MSDFFSRDYLKRQGVVFLSLGKSGSPCGCDDESPGVCPWVCCRRRGKVNPPKKKRGLKMADCANLPGNEMGNKCRQWRKLPECLQYLMGLMGFGAGLKWP